jgi:hypothetical protein
MLTHSKNIAIEKVPIDRCPFIDALKQYPELQAMRDRITNIARVVRQTAGFFIWTKKGQAFATFPCDTISFVEAGNL